MTDMTTTITAENLHSGYIVQNDYQRFIILDCYRAASNTLGTVIEAYVEDQSGQTFVKRWGLEEKMRLACDCGKGLLCPEFGRKFRNSPNYRAPLKVSVTLTVMVDREEWEMAYGADQSAADIREGVKSMFHTEGIFASDSGAEVVAAK